VLNNWRKLPIEIPQQNNGIIQQQQQQQKKTAKVHYFVFVIIQASGAAWMTELTTLLRGLPDLERSLTHSCGSMSSPHHFDSLLASLTKCGKYFPSLFFSFCFVLCQAFFYTIELAQSNRCPLMCFDCCCCCCCCCFVGRVAKAMSSLRRAVEAGSIESELLKEVITNCPDVTSHLHHYTSLVNSKVAQTMMSVQDLQTLVFKDLSSFDNVRNATATIA
jgi:hypothetical protein